MDQKGPYPIANPDAWQPLQRDGEKEQGAATPQWGKVLPFSEPLPDVPPPFPLLCKGGDQASLYRIQVSYIFFVFQGVYYNIMKPKPWNIILVPVPRVVNI